jgi:hypothetical protein
MPGIFGILGGAAVVLGWEVAYELLKHGLGIGGEGEGSEQKQTLNLMQEAKRLENMRTKSVGDTLAMEELNQKYFAELGTRMQSGLGTMMRHEIAGIGGSSRGFSDVDLGTGMRTDDPIRRPMYPNPHNKVQNSLAELLVPPAAELQANQLAATLLQEDQAI